VIEAHEHAGITNGAFAIRLNPFGMLDSVSGLQPQIASPSSFHSFAGKHRVGEPLLTQFFDARRRYTHWRSTLNDQQPHNAMIGEIVFMIDHLMNDGRVEMTVDLAHGYSGCISKA
jgi:hypothetical protein